MGGVTASFDTADNGSLTEDMVIDFPERELTARLSLCGRGEHGRVVPRVMAHRDLQLPNRYIRADGRLRVPLQEMTAPDVPSAVLGAATRWVEGVTAGRSAGLLLVGPMGHGKSMLAAATAVAAILGCDDDDWPDIEDDIAPHRGTPGVPHRPLAAWVGMSGYFARQRDTFDAVPGEASSNRSHQLALHRCLMSSVPQKTPRIVVFDDLGRTQRDEPTEWERSLVEELMRARYEVDRPVIITSNHGVDKLDEMYGVGDILREMCEVVSYVRPAGSRRSEVGLARRSG